MDFDEVTGVVLPDLGSVAADLRALATTLETASGDAAREQADREADRERWHAELAAERAAANCELPSGRQIPC